MSAVATGAWSSRFRRSLSTAARTCSASMRANAAASDFVACRSESPYAASNGSRGLRPNTIEPPAPGAPAANGTTKSSVVPSGHGPPAATSALAPRSASARRPSRRPEARRLRTVPSSASSAPASTPSSPEVATSRAGCSESET